MKHESLEEFFDEKLAQAGPPPDPLEMGVRPPREATDSPISPPCGGKSAPRAGERINRFLKIYEGV